MMRGRHYGSLTDAWAGRSSEPEQAQYRTALVCVSKGHIITADLEKNSERAAPFCNECGSPTISGCPECRTPIRGYYDVPGFVRPHPETPPRFCHGCGKPYPWTAAALKAAHDLVDLVGEISEDERQLFKRSIEELTTEGPTIELAAVRVKQLLARAGKGVGDALWRITVDVASEAAKKILLGGL